MISGHELRRALEVWRAPELTRDAGGGRANPTLELVGTVRAKVSQATTEGSAEAMVAAQAGAHHTHTIHLRPEADVRRGDELRGDGDTFKVFSTVQPSTAIYLRANAELRQVSPATF